MNNRLISQTKIKKIILISNLVAVSVIFSIFDKIISQFAFPFLPTAKIGLANIVILIGVYRFTFKESFVMVILKVALSGLILGSVISFTISFFASMLSFFGMYYVYKGFKNILSPIGVSVIGGFLHIIGQLIIVYLLYQIGDAVLYYGAVLIFVSIITSIIIGYVCIRLMKFFEQIESS